MTPRLANAAARAYCDLHIETNHANLSGFSGVMTSPFFMSPTGAQNPLKVDLGMNISF